MRKQNALIFARKHSLIAALMLSCVTLLVTYTYLYGQDKSDFPEGYDAVQAAPNSHKVIFENSIVRVLEVTVPPTGATEPMHHHRWPSIFLSWDSGGKTPHVRYHRADGSVADQASKVLPTHPGAWSVGWMKPEPMHSIEVVENPETGSTLAPGPSLLRVEIKCHP